MHREKYPERVPFRLTRMMERAMGPTGIEGNFRITCENTMKVLRTNKDSVMAMLEAFVHDPLINWRLLHVVDNQGGGGAAGGGAGTDGGHPAAPLGGLNANEALNERAVAVMERMTDKLVGRDFAVEGQSSDKHNSSVASQVQKLIAQATCHENLCQAYIGWCAFW